MMLGARVGEWVAQAGAGMLSSSHGWHRLADAPCRALLLGCAPHSRRGVSACACARVCACGMRAAATYRYATDLHGPRRRRGSLSRGSHRARGLARWCMLHKVGKVARIDTGAASGGSTPALLEGAAAANRGVIARGAQRARPMGSATGPRSRTGRRVAAERARPALAGRRRGSGGLLLLLLPAAACARPPPSPSWRQTSLTSSSPTQLSSPHTTHPRPLHHHHPQRHDLSLFPSALP